MDFLAPNRNLFVNSRFRATGTSSNFSIFLENTPLKPKNENTMHSFAVVTKLVVPMTMRSVNSTNNVLSITEVDDNTLIPLTFDVTIGAGAYDLYAFEQAVQQAFINASAIQGYTLTYVITIDSATGHMVFEMTTAGYTVYLNFGSPTTANDVLGLPTSGTSSAITPSASYTGTGIVSIGGPKMLALRSPNFVANFYESRVGGYSNIIALVPVTAPPYFVQIWEATAIPKIRAPFSVPIDQLNLYLTDENGVELDLQGEDIQVELDIYDIPRPDAYVHPPEE